MVGNFYKYNGVIGLGLNMRTPCELIVTAVLPAFRSLIARELIEKHSFSQVKAAETLGITQAAISQYMSHKRGNQLADTLETNPETMSVVLDATAKIVSNEFTPVEIMMTFCKLCGILRKQSVACTLHHETMDLPEDCSACQL